MLVPPKAPNNCQWSTCNPTNTKHENRRDMIYLSSACRRCKCYLPQPKPWSYHCGWEEQPFPHDRNIAKQKTGWHKESGRMEATATGTTTHIGGNIYIYFFRSGEEDKRIGCSQDKGGRIQSIAHSQPPRSGKEGVDYVGEQVWMLMMITTSPHFTHF